MLLGYLLACLTNSVPLDAPTELEAIRSSWGRIQKYYNNAHTQETAMKSHFVLPDGKKQTVSEVSSIARSYGKNILYHSKSNAKESIFVKNEHYLFSIGKQRSDDNWMVIGIGKEHDKSELTSAAKTYNSRTMARPDCVLMLYNFVDDVELLDIDSKQLSVSKQRLEDSDFTTIDFTFKYSMKSGYTSNLTGSITCRKSNDYSPVSIAYRSTDGAIFKATLEYSEKAFFDKYRPCVKCVRTLTTPDGTMTQFEFQYKYYVSEKDDKSDYFLPKYGIAEPDSPSPGPKPEASKNSSPFFNVTITACVVLIAAAFLFRRLSYR
jgi:hypothetical protein